MRINFQFRSLVALSVLLVCFVAKAQTPAPPKKAVPARPSPTVGDKTSTRQVVTIVHRLNGLKMFRMLLRSQEQVEAITNLDDAFNLTEDVHTNIIAGLALEDGQTIAAWLPEAEVEFGPAMLPMQYPRTRVVTPETRAGRAARPPVKAFPFRGSLFGSPDLTVIGPDGQRSPAEFVGLDGVTGLSILRLTKTTLMVGESTNKESLEVGETVRVLGPERAAQTRSFVRGLYVRMGSTSGTIHAVNKAPIGGGVARLVVRSPRLSLANIGGVAVNEAGETLGIVDAVVGPDASVLPTDLIQNAAKRVLERQSNVPRPWLGVKGEPVAEVKWENFKSLGWKMDRAQNLLEDHRGILLTSIAPGSPAALAALKAGDVILKVNNHFVEGANEFSWMLDEVAFDTPVNFTIARPTGTFEVELDVKLSGPADFSFAFGSTSAPTGASLVAHGIETVVLRPQVALKFGASEGLLVIYVDPTTPAFDAGFQPGDVIESIDGKPLLSLEQIPPITPGSKSVFQVVRKNQKLKLVL
jgi:serine protease Do